MYYKVHKWYPSIEILTDTNTDGSGRAKKKRDKNIMLELPGHKNRNSN